MGLGWSQLDMKKYLLGSFVGAFAAILLLGVLLGAVGPGVNHNNFTTNVPGTAVVGPWSYSNANTITLTTNFITFDENGINEFRGGGAMWTLVAWSSGNNTTFNWNGGQSALFTNGSGLFAVQDKTVNALRVAGATGQAVQYASILDGAGNEIGYFRTNCFWATTNDFFTVLVTTDNTTNNIFTLTMRDNSAVRVIVDVIGYNSTSSASYGKVATFKSVGGSVTQVGNTATVGAAEDDAAYECLVDVSTDIIRVRVAGNTAKTVDWKCYVKTIYSE